MRELATQDYMLSRSSVEMKQCTLYDQLGSVFEACVCHRVRATLRRALRLSPDTPYI